MLNWKKLAGIFGLVLIAAFALGIIRQQFYIPQATFEAICAELGPDGKCIRPNLPNPPSSPARIKFEVYWWLLTYAIAIGAGLLALTHAIFALLTKRKDPRTGTTQHTAPTHYVGLVLKILIIAATGYFVFVFSSDPFNGFN